MPQLDLISFFPQIFWSFILFFSFFFYLSFAIIPKVATILKFRQKSLIILANKINNKKDSSSFLLIEYDTVLKNVLNEITNLFQHLSHCGQARVPIIMVTVNKTIFQGVNQRFLNNAFFKGMGL